MKKKIIWIIMGAILLGMFLYFGFIYYAKNGTRYNYYYGGTLSSKYHLKNGKENGESFSYYFNGNIKTRYFKKDGFIDFSEEQTEYYPNGQILWHKNLTNTYTEYYLNGSINTIGNYDESGNKTGEWNQYDEIGNHIATIIYKEGKPYSGNIYEYIYRYSGGVDREDTVTSYLYSIRNYNGGELNGIQYEYYENGNLKKLEHYKNGQKEGKEVEYREDGSIKEELMYRNGEMIRNTKYGNSGK